MEVKIYTDGSYRHKLKKGGWAAIIKYPDLSELSLSGQCDGNTTHHRMEIEAAINGIKALEEPSTVTVYTDSKYLCMGGNVLLEAWLKANWQKPDGEPVRNADLWKELALISQTHTVEFKWIKGHAENQFNQWADMLARDASRGIVLR